MIKRYDVKSYKQYETSLLRILYVLASDNYSTVAAFDISGNNPLNQVVQPGSRRVYILHLVQQEMVLTIVNGPASTNMAVDSFH